MLTPAIRLYRNPWSKTLNDGVVLQILQTAATNMAERMQEMIDNGEVKDGSDSFGVVLMDPTSPRKALSFAECVAACVTLGPNGWDLLLNAAAKADAHDRHGVPNGVLVDHASYCLGDDDFAWGYSAEYPMEVNDTDGSDAVDFGLAIAAGSGLSAEQDGQLAYMFLAEAMSEIRRRRDEWIAERRRNGSQGWYNEANKPGEEYAAIHNLSPIASL